MCGYFCIGFIDFMLAGKKLTGYTNLFFSHDLKKKNDNLVLSYFLFLLNIIPLKQLTKQIDLNKQNFD